jgi:hypothetical protein
MGGIVLQLLCINLLHIQLYWIQKVPVPKENINEINQRILEVRKSLGLNQKEFNGTDQGQPGLYGSAWGYHQPGD